MDGYRLPGWLNRVYYWWLDYTGSDSLNPETGCGNGEEHQLIEDDS